MSVRRVVLFLAGVAMILLSRPATGAEPAQAEILDSLRAAEAGFAKAFADRDLDAFLAYIDEDALFLGRTALRGKSEVAEQWSRFFESETAPFSWEPKRWELNPSGTMGLTTGPVYDPEGNWIGAFMSIWSRRPDGSWKVIFDGGPECPRSKPE